MTTLLPWPSLVLLATVPLLPILLRRLPSRPRAVLRIVLVVATVTSGWVAATELVRLVRLVTATPWAALVLDLTPIEARIAEATARLARQQDLDLAIAAALEDGDLERARALARIAVEHGRPLAPATVEALARADGPVARGLRQVRDVVVAAATGRAETPAGIATTLAIDLTPAGDLRDIALETARWGTGGTPDPLILGLATAGLAATAATAVLPAAGAPAVAGKAVLKAALRAGRAGGGLAADLRRALGEAVDLNAMRAAAREITGDPRLAARHVRGDVLRHLQLTAATLGEVATTQGPATALAVVRAAERLDDLPVLARVAKVTGKRADDTLNALGRGTIPALRLGRTAARIVVEFAMLATALAASGAGLLATAAQASAVRAARRTLRSGQAQPA